MSTSSSARRPLCFVLMPFGTKADPTGRPPIDFDRVFSEAIRPAIEAAGMTAIRADEERSGGIIHKPMFERLLLCEYAVADLTSANANVFYELGVRHTARPRTTQAIFAGHQQVPFDVGFLRGMPYDLGPQNRFGPEEAEALRVALGDKLTGLRTIAARAEVVDSPLFQLLGEWKPGEIAHLKADVFHERALADQASKERIAEARRMRDLNSLRAFERELEDLDSHDAGVLVELMLAYRSLDGFGEMVALYDRMPAYLKGQVLCREQLAFALNRRADKGGGRPDKEHALEVLRDLEAERGSSSETCGIMGRVYKDLWRDARRAGSREATRLLYKAIDAYRRGFHADWRDYYPGVNLVTLLDITGDRRSLDERDSLIPVVRFSAERDLGTRNSGYWGYATMLEIAVLAGDAEGASGYLNDALAEKITDQFWPKTTADNLQLIREARALRGEALGWLDEIIAALEERYRHLAPQQTHMAER